LNFESREVANRTRQRHPKPAKPSGWCFRLSQLAKARRKQRKGGKRFWLVVHHDPAAAFWRPIQRGHPGGMRKYSVFAIAREAMRGGKGWEEQWSSPEPKAEYDVVIVGAGGHGLASAYYLAKEHGITNVAVLEKGWLGGGNTGRNTTIIRSNYLYDESAGIYDHAVKLWDGLSQDLNYNVMYSPRGVMMLAHSVHDTQVLKRHIHANRLNGVDNEWLTPEQAKEFCPPLNISKSARYPVVGAALQRRGGTARHDAVAWGYARGANARGVDIIQNCEVKGIRRAPDGRVTGVETTKGFIGAKKVGVVAAGHSSVIMQMADVRMPLESYPLQALVSEPVKPVFPCVVMSNTVHAYISQSDKGELVIGAGTDQYVSYSQTGGPHIINHTLDAICEMFPMFTRMKMLRSWGGIVDVTPDRSPILAKTPVPGLYVNCGWGTGGFKATPGSGHVFAHTIATDQPHPINAPFTLERFRTGRLIDEAAAAAVAH
jgi:sarcosine oxidase subunit beta